MQPKRALHKFQDEKAFRYSGSVDIKDVMLQCH